MYFAIYLRVEKNRIFQNLSMLIVRKLWKSFCGINIMNVQIKYCVLHEMALIKISLYA